MKVLSRRDFLRAAASGAAAFGALPALLRALADAAEGGAGGLRSLILVELKGGNDGLNTVVPYADARYHELRPRLAVPRERVLRLDEALGLHPALEPLWPLWRERALAVALGVGYPEPNRSHFRSIDIWETASDAREYRGEGWLAAAFSEAGERRGWAADGIVLGEPEAGPLSGPGARAIVLREPEAFFRNARRLREAAGRTENPALAHILKVQADVHRAAEALEERLSAAPAAGAEFPKNPFGRQLETIARLLSARTPVPVFKATLGGFDTHANQQKTHERLLGELAGGLAALRKALGVAGLWDRCLIMTYSEFGRRARENGSAGTDHGTAAPHFLLGGRVRGGLYGRQPPLDRLEDGDLRHTLDFRSLYATAARGWWGLPAKELPRDKYPELPCL